MLKKLIIPALALIITTTAVYVFVNAGNLNPTLAPGDTMYTLEDIYCKITGCTASTSYALSRDGTATGTMYTLEEIYDVAEPPIDFSPQKNQIYDDYNCANNNAEADTACGAGDAEYTGEESTWTLYTDSSLDGALVTSGKVYLDNRTGLYWADAYDAISGNNTPDTITNSFTIGTGCSDAQINAGECDSSMYQTKGLAVQYCLDLSLDADGDGTDETDWYLPTQKELMQAYINGAGNNLPNPARNYWSASEFYNVASFAWSVSLSNGYTYFDFKTVGYYARCVRR